MSSPTNLGVSHDSSIHFVDTPISKTTRLEQRSQVVAPGGDAADVLVKPRGSRPFITRTIHETSWSAGGLGLIVGEKENTKMTLNIGNHACAYNIALIKY